MEDIVSEVLINDTTISSSHPVLIVETPPTINHQCKICGVPALHSNYGVMTCSPCKMFFKRNAEKGQGIFTCAFDGHCEINVNNRHVCAACRLDQCFANGMQAELIRCPISKKNVPNQRQNIIVGVATTTCNILIRKGEHHQSQLLPTLNLLRSDNSTLTSSQWTLLSNLVHSYDESKLMSIAQQFINENNIAQSLDTLDLTLPIEFFTTVYETSGAYLHSNGDLCTLTSDDRFTFLNSAAETITCLGAVFSWSRSQLYDHKPFIDACIKIYGQASVLMIKHVLQFIDPDIVIAKLALSLFVFSNYISIFSSNLPVQSLNTLAIFHIQNTYAEVTWKYLVYRYGHCESIQRFMNLIQCLIAATDSAYNAHTIEQHVNDIKLLIEQTELALTLDDIERMVENKN